ncbi:bis(5'-nucleosyl)-tetraphosphatase (symmetrical) YqeK [Candidatus Phytoplasma melaleucae]|uniref:bis(5'-nucleosyl)-tetraphosphatase (symmetrical) n=1 Tax=Candidatus Phytoplasma melaleucae TaxID=2982630 RepID=A0ABT9DEL1_9MOLU|nr:bis(5'-nucleosyl)-tetraphosphatase (symmetrical) YqeK ['Melaleuca sp.' phytoplasma]MDO8168248.1 bis(5'-nucleosyl)-tetraphosphatase (symmetrical) YqeK ['Melaleuca sp.' phytoplasma]MDV3205304.1 bis(5'-nucleosyl)-tetraphosphatase (symmetrical) YqeK [Weeping tea tree witches'-broom phytoplasma]
MLIETIFKKINTKFKNDILRFNHTLGVYQMAIQLANFYKINDLTSIKIAALFHDYTKNEPLEFHLSLLSNLVISKYKQTPFMYHAFSASVMLQREFNIHNKKILHAINKHVWGHQSMNKLDKIILVSDKLENSRDFPKINYFRKLAFENLDQVVYQLLEYNLNYYQSKGFRHYKEPLTILKVLKIKMKL